MIRKAFVMSVNPDCYTEYKHRHDEIWPELTAELKKHGAHNYNIFWLKETNQLFGYVEVDNEQQWDAMADTSICQKWWKYMRDIMPTNPDNSPISQDLTPMFYLA